MSGLPENVSFSSNPHLNKVNYVKHFSHVPIENNFL